MKSKSRRVLPQKDRKQSPEKLSEYDKLVQACTLVMDLYYQANSQQGSNRNNIGSKSCSVFDQVGKANVKYLGKKPIQEDGALFFNKDTILVGSTPSISGQELLKGSKTNMGGSTYTNNIDSVRCSVFDQVGQVNVKSWGKKAIQEDGALFFKDKILVGSTSCIPREELFTGSKTNMGESSYGHNIDPVHCSVSDQVGKVNGIFLGKKPIQEDGALFFKDKILVGSTSCIPREELFKGSKTNMGESSSGRFCKLKTRRSVDDHEYSGDKKVVNGNDYDGYFLNKKSDRFVEEKACDESRERKRSRKCFDSSEYDQDFECFEKKKKPRTICNARQKVAKLTSPLPVEFKNEIQEMGGTDIKLIIQKKLFSADTLVGQNRFSIPMKQIRENFLTDEEKSMLDQRFKDNHVVPLMIPLIEPNLEKTQINFRKWACNSSYVLSSPWNEIRERNALKAEMEMQLWSFRVDGALNMAMVKVSDGL